MANEFDLIHRYFAPLAGPEGLELKDDAACLKVVPGFDLIVTKDMLVEGVHFFGNDPASSIGHKSLAVNLSDLAAKGATPSHYFLGLSLPASVGGEWLAEFSAGLANLQRRSGIRLAGGDTTRSLGGVVVSITAMGTVSEGRMVRRFGARPGDMVFVTGTLGDAALGLKCLEGEIKSDARLIARYHYPEARTALGAELASIASSSADVSDGLLADLEHITAASGVGAEVALRQLPLSEACRDVLADAPEHETCVYAGGDDYELVFTAPPSRQAAVEALCSSKDVSVTAVGTITEKAGVRLIDQSGALMHTARSGFQHFET